MGRQSQDPVAGGREKRVELFTSTLLLAELTDILSRHKFEKKIVASMLTVDQLVDRYAEVASVVRPTPTPRIAPDPGTTVAIGTALAAKADLLVTGIGLCYRWPSIRALGSWELPRRWQLKYHGKESFSCESAGNKGYA